MKEHTNFGLSSRASDRFVSGGRQRHSIADGRTLVCDGHLGRIPAKGVSILEALAKRAK